MRIGVDARELCGKPTGVGRYLSGLLREWSRNGAASSHTFILYANAPLSTPMSAAELRVIPGSPGTVWEQISLPPAIRHDGLDVFFAPGYSAPLLLKIPTVLTVHDISFVAHPEWFRWKEGLRRRTLTRWSSRRANLVLTDSDVSRREIVSYFGLAPELVKCIYPGVIPLPSHAAGSREPVVLFVGSVLNRRHLPDLIRAFRPVARAHASARLEIVGDNRTFPHEDLPAIAATEGIATQVSIRPYVSDAELAELYARARAFAFLSEYEGFGLPPLEALSSGVPSVMLDTDIAREVCGDAAIYVPNGDRAAITEALTRLLFDDQARRRVLQAGPAVLERYSWPRAAAATLEALVAVSRKAGRT
jgi:glycosyltransferase involved in cell wall biosynthesis